MLAYFLRNIEIFFIYPFVILFGQLRFFSAQRGAVGTAMAAFALLVRASVTDHCLHFDQRWTFSVAFRFFERRFDGRQIVAVFHTQRLPAVSFETLTHVLREAEIQLAVQRDVVGVIEENQFAKLQVTGERCRFTGHALHQVAVAADAVRIVIDHFQIAFIVSRSQLGFCKRHPYCHRQTLTKRAGCRIHTSGMTKLRMTRRFTAPLAELFNFFHREVVPGQVQ
ncbi:hypothetical protein D3C74_283840 [compost metagenome]